MQDLEFYNVPVGGGSLKLRLLAPFRRLARKLMLPFFRREVEIMREVLKRVDDGVHAHQTLRDQTDQVGGAFWQFASRVESIDKKSENLNRKFDQLNLKFDQLNLKMESMIGKFEELRSREDDLRSEFSALVGMHWDHLAMGRRLAQLEDELIAGERSESSGYEKPLPFPGLERLQRPQAG
jgi:hypothetical protein